MQFGKDVPKPSPTADDVKTIEKLINAKLPASYIEFLNFSNGGYPKTDTLFHHDVEWVVNNFFQLSTSRDSIDDLEGIIWQYNNRWESAAREILPIGSDALGNLFCLDLTEHSSDRVILWIHDEPHPSIREIANSFENFIDMLEIPTGDS